MAQSRQTNLDRNANNKERFRRNAQRARGIGITSAVKVGAPLQNTGSLIQLNLLSTGGLQTTSSQLGIKLNSTSLALGASGIAVNLKTNSALQISSGLGVQVNGTSLSLGASGISVALKTNSGLQISSGLGIQLLTNSGLQLGASGLGIILASGGLALGGSGLSLNVDPSGYGLAIGSGGLKWTSPTTTKGDIFIHSFSGFGSPTPDRLPVGANDTMLTPDSTLTPGLKWSTTANLTAYKVGGTQVVGAQGAAVADATGAGDVVAQLNALLARVRTHGLIAP